jgi:hypothetical protein
MNENKQEWADRVGKRAATVFVAALAVIFAYGYLSHFVVG